MTPDALSAVRLRAAASRARPLPLGLSLRFEDLACALLFAFFAMQGSIPGIAPAQSHEMTGSIRTAYTTIGGISTQLAANALLLLLVIRHPRLLLRNLTAVALPAVLALLAIASSIWSLDPLLTLRRSIPFALAGLFGLWFAARFPARRQLAILRLAMTALAIATIAVVVLLPSTGLDHSPGHHADWQGIFPQKNACGRIMVLATCAVLFDEALPASRLAPLVLFIAPLVLFTLVLSGSGSRGAWLVEAAMLLLWLVLQIGRRSTTRTRIALGLAAPAVVVILAGLSAVLFPRLILWLGRDPTLSGRTAIWTQVLHAIAQRPLLGYGYDAFWRGMEGPSLDIDSAVHFIVEHAHNGFLEIALELGALGLCLFLLSWLNAWRRAWPLGRSGELGRIAFPLAVLALIFLYGLDENTLLIYNGLFWPLYVATVANIRFAARDQDHTLSPAPHAILMQECENTRAPALPRQNA